MKGLFLFVALLVAALVLSLVADSAKAHHGGARVVVVDDFGNVRAVRSGHVRSAPVVEIQRGFFGRVRSVRVR